MQGQIFGRHRVTRLLGSGGMAEVWAARHITDRDHAVVKLMRPDVAKKPGMVQQFLREARAVASVDDPGIVRVIDFGIAASGRPFLILERLWGESLEERLRRDSRLTVKCALGLMRQLARTMAVAHDQGIVHCDLKPDNLFLVRDVELTGGERIKVLDFGLARWTSGPGAIPAVDGVISGTPAYMAPEQSRKPAQVDHRADLYSMGCVLYRMLCGVAPFGTEVGAIYGQRHAAPRSPQLMHPDIPQTVSDLVMQLLHKSPDRRVQTCMALIERIDNCLNPVVPVVDDDTTEPCFAQGLHESLGSPALLPLVHKIPEGVAPAHGSGPTRLPLPGKRPPFGVPILRRKPSPESAAVQGDVSDCTKTKEEPAT